MVQPSNVYSDLPDDPVSDKNLHVLPSGCSWDGEWELTSDLVVKIQTSEEGVLAIAYQLKVEEYGSGASLEEAVLDLLTSLSEYRESLVEREAKLGAPAAADLAILRSIIRWCGQR